MNGRDLWRVGVGCIAVASAILAGCPTGYRLVQVNGEPPSIDNRTWDHVDCTARALRKATGACAERKLPKVLLNCSGSAAEQARCNSAPGARGQKVLNAPGNLTKLISFVHLSDAQLKEHAVRMDGPVNEIVYDGLTNGAMRSVDLEKNDDAVLLATTLAINELSAERLERIFRPYPAPAAPSFVIHTGDSVDAGVFSEQLQFIAAMDALDVPWFNVVGNHDNLFFGTFPHDKMRGLHVLIPFVPILDTQRFMRFHGIEGVSQDLSLPAPSQRSENHPPTVRGRRRLLSGELGPEPLAQRSNFHGFNLVCPPGGVAVPNEKGTLCNEARGYYAFDAPLADGSGNLRSIVLNTAEVTPVTVGSGFDRRSAGNMLPEQLDWLKRQIDEDRADIDPAKKGKDLFIVFGHHDLRSFLYDKQAAELKQILFSSPRVLGYLTGHRHTDDVVAWKRNDGSQFWEVIGGSTLVFPQLGQLTDLLQDNNRNLFLRVSPFRQQLGDDPSLIPQAPAPRGSTSAEPPEPGAAAPKEDVCLALEDGVSFCHRLAARASLGRAGAAADKDDDRRDEAVAVEKVAGVLRVGIRIPAPAKP